MSSPEHYVIDADTFDKLRGLACALDSRDEKRIKALLDTAVDLDVFLADEDDEEEDDEDRDELDGEDPFSDEDTNDPDSAEE